jgi:hypothetical protein
MITCQHARHLFDSYLDGALSASLQTELHAHRLNCTACQNELAVLEACGDVIAMDRREPEVSGDFTSRVLLAYCGRPVVRPRRWRRVAWRVGAPLAAAASIAMVMSLTVPRSHPERNTAILGTTVALPSEIRDAIQNPAHRLSDQARRELERTPQMSKESLFVTVETSCERLKDAGESIRHLREAVGWLVPETNTQLAALWQGAQQKDKPAPIVLPEQTSGGVDPSDPSYLNSSPAAPGPDVADGDGPAAI